MNLTEKQKIEIEKTINEYPDYLSIHDQDIITYKVEGDTLKLRFALCGIGYYYNRDTLEEYWEDEDNDFIVDEIFYGVKDFELDTDFDIRCSIALNNDHLKENKMRFIFSNDESYARMEFKFDSFEWKIIGEFDAMETSRARDSIDLPEEQWHWLLKL